MKTIANPLISIGFRVFLLLLATFSVMAGANNATVPEFETLRTGKETVVLDVRTPSEYAGGHIAGAVNINYYSRDLEQQLAKLDLTKTYLVYCAVGGRSARVCQVMEKLKFTKVHNLKGGIGAWTSAGKPVER